MAINNKNNPDSEDIVAEINMTPLIDIMLVLLIIFMVTSSLSLESGLQIDVPKVEKTENSSESNAIIVSLTNDGRIAVQGQVVEMNALKESIAQALKKEGTEMVVLEGDKASRLGAAVEIIDIAKSAGARKFAIAAEKSN
ncbi:MAG: protein TolR [Bdellovibrio sp.]